MQCDFCHVIPPWIIEDAGFGRFSGEPIPLALVQRFLLDVFFGAELSAAFR